MPRPLSIYSPYAKNVKQYFGGPLYSVNLVPVGDYNGCYWNATHVAQKIGATVVCGYRVTDYDGVLLEGVHHAIVKMPDGELVDVTPYEFSGFGQVSFVPDGSQIPSLEIPAYLDNIFVPLKHHEVIEQLAKAHKEACKAQRSRAEIIYRAGYSFQPGVTMELDIAKLEDKGECLNAENIAIEKLTKLHQQVRALVAGQL